MAKEGGDEREGERGDKHFVTYSHGEVRRAGGGGEEGFFSALFLCFFFVKETLYCNTGVGGVFLPISKAIAILSSEQLQGCSLLSLLFLHINLILHLQVSATTLSNERPDNTEPKSSKQTLTCINLSNHSTLFRHTSFLANQLLRRHLVMIMR